MAIVLIERPATLATSTALFNPIAPLKGSRGPDKLRYHVGYPDDTAPRGVRYAHTIHAPAIVLDPDKIDHRNAWKWAHQRAQDWRISPEVLFIGRRLRLAVDIVPNQNVGLPSPFGELRPTHFYILRAVEVLGDFDKFEELDRRIAEIKAWFDA